MEEFRLVVNQQVKMTAVIPEKTIISRLKVTDTSR